ncbi:MAG: PP2C family protein-serine/threonine phosphatase [Pirellulales bacterium]
MSTLDSGLDPLQSPAELQRRLTNLEKLLQLTRQLASDIEIEQILERITHAACDALDCDRASLYQFDPKRQELFTRVVTELEIAEVRQRLGHGISGHVALTRQLANVPHPADDLRWNPNVDRQTGYHTRNILAAPLLSADDDRLLGVLEVFNRRQGSFDEFDEHMLEAFCRHAATALDRARLIDELNIRNRIEASLGVARDVQRGFMPSRLPEVPGYELAVWWLPNQAIGGDYCDVLRLRDGRLGLVIADVSGHGLGPSLIMASVRAALRALTLEYASPRVLLELLARALAPDLQNGRFITLALAAVHPEEHTLELANAGHAPALLYRAAPRDFITLEAGAMPLGVLDEPAFDAEKTLPVAAGDIVVLCTDGIVEAMNDRDEQFGRQRLEELVIEHAAAPIDELVQAVARSVEAHYVGESPADDLTILVLRRNA